MMSACQKQGEEIRKRRQSANENMKDIASKAKSATEELKKQKECFVEETEKFLRKKRRR